MQTEEALAMAQLEAMWQDDGIEYIFAESEMMTNLEEDDEEHAPRLDEGHDTSTTDQDLYGNEDGDLEVDLVDETPWGLSQVEAEMYMFSQM